MHHHEAILDVHRVDQAPGDADAQFVASVAINSGLGLSFFLIFAGLRQWCPAVYSPRSHVRLLAAQPAPPLLPHGLFAWLVTLMAVDESRLVQTAGLDAAMYLCFLRLAFQIMIAASLYGFAVLIPIIRMAPDFSFPDTQTAPQSWLEQKNVTSSPVPWLDNLSITHVRSGSPLFWAHLALAYLFTLLTLYLIHLNYQAYPRLRHRFILGSHDTSQQCSEFPPDGRERRQVVQHRHNWVLVNDIPARFRSEAALGAFFSEMYPHTFACCIFARDTRVISQKIATRQKVLERLEHCCANVQLRPTIGLAEPDETEGSLCQVTRGFMRKLLPWSGRRASAVLLQVTLEEQLDALNAHIAASLARSQLNPRTRARARARTRANTHTSAASGAGDGASGWSSEEDDGTLPQEAANLVHNSSLPGMGEKEEEGLLQWGVDVLENLTGIDIDGDGRTGGVDNPVMGSAFVGFRDVQSAIHAQLVQHHTDVSSFTVKSCPAPSDMVWPNVGMPAHSRLIRRLVVLAATFWLMFFWTIPVGLITTFSQLENLVRLFPVLKPIMHDHVMSPRVRDVLSSFIPVLVLKGFMSLLPYILGAMATMEGIEAHSWICARVLNRHCFFQIINVFLGVAVSTGMLSVVVQVADAPTSLAHILGEAVPRAADFFVNYVCLSALTWFPMELCDPVQLVLVPLQRCMARTARSRRAATQACPFHYGHEAPKHLLIFTLGTVYSVVNPVILPFAALYFGFGFVVLKYKMLYVYLPQFEGEGFLWQLLVRHMLVALVLLHLTLLGFLGLKNAHYELMFVVPLPVMTLCMERYWNEAFQRPAQFPPICVLSRASALAHHCNEPAGERESSEVHAREDMGVSQYGGRDMYLSPMLATPYLLLDPQNVREDDH